MMPELVDGAQVFVWPHTSRRKRQATIILSKSQIRRSWTFCAATTSGSAGSKKANAMDMAAVTRTICSGDITLVLRWNQDIELENGCGMQRNQGGRRLRQPWVGQKQFSSLKQNFEAKWT